MANKIKEKSSLNSDSNSYAGSSNPWGCSYFVCLFFLIVFVIIGCGVAVADWLESRLPVKCACVSGDVAADGTKPCSCRSLNQHPESGKNAEGRSEAKTKNAAKNSNSQTSPDTAKLLRTPFSRMLNSLGLFKSRRPRG